MNPVLSQLAVRNGNSAEETEESIMALGEVVSSLKTAVNKLQTLKDSETNQYFRNFETNSVNWSFLKNPSTAFTPLVLKK